MAATTRCKMLCVKEEKDAYRHTNADGEEVKSITPKFILRPVHDPNGDDSENHKFWSATPMGEFWLTISNPDGAEILQAGEYYYLDISHAG